MDKLNKEKGRGSVVITGGTSGLGLECAKVLKTTFGYDVIITGRNKQQGEQLAKNFGLIFLELELSSVESIHNFVKILPEHLPSPFHTLINNAGSQFQNNTTKTEEGLEMTFAVNHLGHFVLTNLLLTSNILQRPARIVNVASGTHDPEQNTGIEPPRFTTAEKVSRGVLEGNSPLVGMKSGQCAYSTSKLCNVLFTFELHRRFVRSGVDDVKVNAFDPGLTPGTNLARDYGPILSFMFRSLPVWGLRMFLSNTHTSYESGRSLAKLAVMEEFENDSGFYYEHENDKVSKARSSRDSISEQFALDLWEESCRLSKLNQNQLLFSDDLNNNNNNNNE